MKQQCPKCGGERHFYYCEGGLSCNWKCGYGYHPHHMDGDGEKFHVSCKLCHYAALEPVRLLVNNMEKISIEELYDDLGHPDTWEYCHESTEDEAAELYDAQFACSCGCSACEGTGYYRVGNSYKSCCHKCPIHHGGQIMKQTEIEKLKRQLRSAKELASEWHQYAKALDSYSGPPPDEPKNIPPVAWQKLTEYSPWLSLLFRD